MGRYPIRVEEGDGARPGDSGGRIGAVACMAETLRHRVDGHGVSLNEGDRGKRKERLREWQSGERGDGSFIISLPGRIVSHFGLGTIWGPKIDRQDW